MALHYAAAARLGAADVMRGLDAQPWETFDEASDDIWPTVPELLALELRGRQLEQAARHE